MADRFMKKRVERKKRRSGHVQPRSDADAKKSAKSKVLDQFLHQFRHQSSTDEDESQSTNAGSQTRPKRRRTRTRARDPTRDPTRKHPHADKENDENVAKGRVEPPPVAREPVEARVTMATGHKDYIKAVKAIHEVKEPVPAPVRTFGPGSSSRLSTKLRGMLRDTQSSAVVTRRDPLKKPHLDSSESEQLPEFQPSRKPSDVLDRLLKSGDRSGERADRASSGNRGTSRSLERLRSRYRTPSSADQSPHWRTPKSATGSKYNPLSTPPDMATTQASMKAALREQVPNLANADYYGGVLSRVRSLAFSCRKERTPEPKRRGMMSGDIATRRRLEGLFTDSGISSAKRSEPSQEVEMLSQQAPVPQHITVRATETENDEDFVVNPVLDSGLAEVSNNDHSANPFAAKADSPSTQGLEWLMEVDSNPFTSQDFIKEWSNREPVRYEERRDYSGRPSEGYRPAYDPYQDQIQREGARDMLDHIGHEPCRCHKCLTDAVCAPTYPSYGGDLCQRPHDVMMASTPRDNMALNLSQARVPPELAEFQHHRRQPLCDITRSVLSSANTHQYERLERYHPMNNVSAHHSTEFRRPPPLHDVRREHYASQSAALPDSRYSFNVHSRENVERTPMDYAIAGPSSSQQIRYLQHSTSHHVSRPVVGERGRIPLENLSRDHGAEKPRSLLFSPIF